MALEIKRRISNILGPARSTFHDDDFNWDTYTKTKYGPQLKRLDTELDARVDDRVSFDDASGKLQTGSANLHPNWISLYEIVGLLKPKSTLEFGCGGGDHVRNLKTLYPSLEVNGGDRSPEQLKLLAARNPEIADRTFEMDVTMPISSKWPRVDLVYSQAVIMHIKTAVSHLNAMANMFNLANEHVVLMENYGCHPLVDDVNRLMDGGHLSWDEVHFHAHHAEGQPHCLVVSRRECQLPKLEDYFALPNAKKIRY